MPGRMRERLFALFVLGTIFLVPPVLAVFNTQVRFLGVPVLYLYLFSAWIALIALVAIIVERAAATEEFTDAAERHIASEAPEPPGVRRDA